MNQQELLERVKLACSWITDVAQIKGEKPTGNINMDYPNMYYPYTCWRGAFKGEYRVAKKQWSFFGLIWHAGQAVKALCLAYPLLKDEKILQAARLSAQFIADNQITDEDDPDFGLIYAFEDCSDKVTVSATLECLDGLLHLARLTGEKKWEDIVVASAAWGIQKAYMKGQGLYHDEYDPKARTCVPNRFSTIGRPLPEDAILLKVYELTGKQEFLDVFIEILDRLLKDEEPAGNWIGYHPCNKDKGSLHPRQAYWWARPMLGAYRHTKQRKYLDCAIRAGDWYVKAQRRDGGLFRGTYDDFSTDSFGHATSAIACAMILWQEIEQTTGEQRYTQSIDLTLDFLLKMQFVNPVDENLKGAILEKVLPPDGTDACPYHIRELGTIFFVQALCKYMKDAK